MRRPSSFHSSRRTSSFSLRSAHPRRCLPAAEHLESRLTLDSGLSQGASAALPDGVDSMSLGDFNGDRVVDLAVAGRQDGHYVVTIYNGDGQASDKTSTGAIPQVLATMIDPLGVGVGPLNVTAGDFTGIGLSDLAISATSSEHGDGSKVGIWSFALEPGASPVDAPVTPTVLASPFTPAGFEGAKGLVVAAGDFDNNGRDQLFIGPANSGSARLVELSYQSNQGFSVEQTITQARVSLQRGVALAAGDLTGDGRPELAVASSQGSISAYNFANQSWSKPIKPLGSKSGPERIAVVAAVNAPGALAATSAAFSGKGYAALVSWKTHKTVTFQPAASPGSGALVPLGGGWLYPRSSIVTPAGSGAFPYSNGPVAPAVILGSTGGSSVVIQDFKASLAPDAADTYVEPVLGQATSTAAFIPLQDASSAKPADGTSSKLPPIVAYPTIVYHSPYSIVITDSKVFNGLPGNSPIKASKPYLWGPTTGPVNPPAIPASATADWLRQHVIAAYMQVIGDSYQHHHDPRWLPKQGSPWNVATLGYQVQGVDCTNLTAYAYKVALGITMNSATPVQAAISPTNTAKIQIPSSIASDIQLKVLPGSTDYNSFVKELLPGDILYINPTMKPGAPSDPSGVTHAITWLGQYGVDKNGRDKYLIIDSTGKQPAHIDSNNQVVTPGVEIRPFGAPGPENDWYFTHVDHVLRIIAS